MARIVSLLALVAAIVGVGILFFLFMSSFLVPLFLAAVITVIFRPLHERFAAGMGGRQRIAAIFSTTAALLLTLLPIGAVLTMASVEGVKVARQINYATLRQQTIDYREHWGLDAPNAARFRSMQESLAALSLHVTEPTPEVAERRLADLRSDVTALQETLDPRYRGASNPRLTEFGSAIDAISVDDLGSRDYEDKLAEATTAFEALRTADFGGSTLALFKSVANPSDDELRAVFQRIGEEVRSSIVSFTGSAGVKLFEFVVGLVILIVATYFFFADGPAMLQGTVKLIPLEEEYVLELLDEFSRVSRAVFMATMLAAAAQAVTAAIGYWFADVPNLFILTLVTFVMSTVPFFGAGSVFFTVCAYLIFVEERTLAGVLLAVYGLTIVSTVDNVIKPFILHGQSNINPLLALLSILGGIKVLGPVGLLVGPLVVVYLSTMLRILQRELTSFDDGRFRLFGDGRRRAGRYRRSYGPLTHRRSSGASRFRTGTP